MQQDRGIWELSHQELSLTHHLKKPQSPQKTPNPTKTKAHTAQHQASLFACADRAVLILETEIMSVSHEHNVCF